MELQIVPFHQFTEDLIRYIERQQVTFLIGAGVSMLAPCSLPSGSEIKDSAVSTICDTGRLRKYWVQINGLPKYQLIVPEIVFQVFHEHLGHKLFPFFEILRYATPNIGHTTLSSLCSLKNTPVLTTNFDLLIDQYFDGKSPVIHLHGHIDDKKSIITTISQIGKGLRGDTLHAIKHHTNDRILCVLGYSGNDDDIRYKIITSGAKSIFWLVRGQGDRAWTNFKFLKNYPGTFAVAQGDLKALFMRIVDYFNLEFSKVVSYQDTDAKRQEALRVWSKQLGAADRFACVSKLLIELEEYLLAREVARNGFNIGMKIGNGGWFKNQLAFASRMVGDFDEFQKIAKESLKLNRAESNKLGIAIAHNYLGLAKLEKDQPDPKPASAFFRKAIRILEYVYQQELDIHRRELLLMMTSQVYNNLGLALRYEGNSDEALRAYKQSLSVKRRIGYLIGISQTCVNISLVHYKQKNFDAAYRWRKRALDLIHKYDLNFQKAYLYREMGDIACGQGRMQVGIGMLEKALSIYEEIETSRFGVELTQRIIKDWKENIDALRKVDRLRTLNT